MSGMQRDATWFFDLLKHRDEFTVTEEQLLRQFADYHYEQGRQRQGGTG